MSLEIGKKALGSIEGARGDESRRLCRQARGERGGWVPSVCFPHLFESCSGGNFADLPRRR